MRHAFIGAALIAVSATAAGAKSNGRDIEISWGKAGVDMAQYRLDAGLCAVRATSVDLRGTPQAQQMVKASRALDNAYEAAWMNYPPGAGGIMFGNPWSDVQRVRQNLRVEPTLDEIRGILTSALHQCLEKRGYRRFALTAEQRQRLKKLGLGSPKRRAYLHSLASDPEVLSRQALPAS